MTIPVYLNGTFHKVQAGTVKNLLMELELTGRLAVEINRSLVPRSCFDSHTIRSYDNIEIVRAVGGG